MQTLTRASEELFRRGPDECFATFDALWQHCEEAKARSVERWHPPTELRVEPYAGQLRLIGGDEATYRLNDWSFTQLCSLAGVSKDTVNRLAAATAIRAPLTYGARRFSTTCANRRNLRILPGAIGQPRSAAQWPAGTRGRRPTVPSQPRRGA